MKLIVDENISFAVEAFSQFGDVELMHGRKITRTALADADALIVRSITNVNEELLSGTPVKFVGTATIGTDHIDQEYLKGQGIAFTDAKGCNADAVAEYIFTALTNIAMKKGISIEGKTIGVVGIGNIGSRIVRLAKSVGMNVLMNDPPVQRATGRKDFVSLDAILTSDIITAHVPLNKGGEDNTVHLFDKDILLKLKDDVILINASRGQVIDNAALLEVIKQRNMSVVLDVWENEPNINPDLLNEVDLASPHIAGYSLEGKVNGTKIIYDALCRFVGKKPSWAPVLPEVDNSILQIDNSAGLTDRLGRLFNSIYDINRDDSDMRKMLPLPENEQGPYFDSLRKNYPLRREFLNYKIEAASLDENTKEILRQFRFTLV